ncbi:MAG: YncE family protein [Bacteroidia bacterium]
MKKYFFLLFFVAAFLVSCNDKPEIVDPPKGDVSKGVFIINEGTFTFGNASLSFYNADSQKVENDVFNRINNRPIGDVFQSMYAYNSKYFCVVNNMQKIEVLNKETLKAEAVIEGMNAPRYFLPINSGKAYVTDLYAKGIWVINPTTYQLLKKIDYKPNIDTALLAWTEQMVSHNNEVFICAPRQKEILVLDANRDEITLTIPVEAQPQWMQKDKNNNIWVLCDGSIDNQFSKLYCINPQTKSILKTLTFDSKTRAVSELKINAAGNVLCYIYKDFFIMSINDNTLPQTAAIQADTKQFYGLGIHPVINEIYISDAIDNIQPGKVYRYSSSGKLLDEFQVGVSPGEFLFAE